ncbi:permease [Legionella sp. PATHC035]|uniref:permease n=1 Tax=Legionella sp. PATHC035 TaxID=2992040 RepID=UPI00224451F6|nr:permease [Legionella sp. PATHC035]MCW8410456.1 permease [Legionella sp. PATHC035]
MIYLSIPPGKVFKKVIEIDEHGSPKDAKDCFVDLEDGSIIELQDLIKEALQNTRRKSEITLKAFTIYLKTPPATEDSFLAYTPNHNGKYSTDVEPEIVIGKNVQKYNPGAQTKYGSFWYSQLFLITDKQLEIAAKMKAQKQDRRHVGDSPKPT